MRQIVLILMVIVATVLSGCSGNGAEQLFDTAKLEELQDNQEHATKLYQEIIQRYPESEYARRAKERLSALGKTDKRK
jgi:TolA-binding protein